MLEQGDFSRPLTLNPLDIYGLSNSKRLLPAAHNPILPGANNLGSNMPGSLNHLAAIKAAIKQAIDSETNIPNSFNHLAFITAAIKAIDIYRE